MFLNVTIGDEDSTDLAYMSPAAFLRLCPLVSLPSDRDLSGEKNQSLATLGRDAVPACMAAIRPKVRGLLELCTWLATHASASQNHASTRYYFKNSSSRLVFGFHNMRYPGDSPCPGSPHVWLMPQTLHQVYEVHPVSASLFEAVRGACRDMCWAEEAPPCAWDQPSESMHGQNQAQQCTIFHMYKLAQ